MNSAYLRAWSNKGEAMGKGGGPMEQANENKKILGEEERFQAKVSVWVIVWSLVIVASIVLGIWFFVQ